MSETKIDVPMADGIAEAYLYTPSQGSGPWPAAMLLTDIMGIRPAFRQMSQRLADQGFVVLLPNVFYRGTKLPILDFTPVFGEERTMKRLGELRGALSNEQMGPDGSAYADFLMAQKTVKGSKVGVVGYCFTGSMSFRIAAAAGSRIAAAASFHGGGLYTDQADSPHLGLSKISARLYFGHAIEDRGMPPEAIEKLEAALKQWTGKGESETYEGARHGWCVPGRVEVYNEVQAERAFAKLVSLFDSSLK